MATKKIVVRFSANSLPLSWAIRARTWSKYSHIDFVMENGSYLGALPFGGVCLHKEKYPTQDFYELEVTEQQYEKILDNAYSQLGKPYDFAGIFGFAFNRDWQEQDKGFCSEFVAAAIQPVIPLFNEQACKISPRDLSIHTKFKKVEYDNKTI